MEARPVVIFAMPHSYTVYLPGFPNVILTYEYY